MNHKMLSFKHIFHLSWKQRHGWGMASLASLAILMAGCLPISLQPFYQEADLRLETALIGRWCNVDHQSDPKNTWTFAKGEKQSYELVIQEGTNASPFIAHLFVIGEQQFLDLTPHGDGLKNAPVEDTYRVALIPGHLFLRVDQIEPKLKMSVMKLDWLKEFLKANPKAIAHQWVANNEMLVLTANTDALQSFLKAHLTDEEAWDNAEEMIKLTQSGGTAKEEK